MRCRERTCAESSGGTASGPRAVSSLGLCRKSCGLRGVAEATAAGAPEASVVLPRGVMLGSWMPMSEPFASWHVTQPLYSSTGEWPRSSLVGRGSICMSPDGFTVSCPRRVICGPRTVDGKVRERHHIVTD